LLILPTIRDEDDEERYKAIGLVEGRLYTAVHVLAERSSAISLCEKEQQK
jgi:uncharacterized DUF497 family protein